MGYLIALLVGVGLGWSSAFAGYRAALRRYVNGQADAWTEDQL